jgi:hypothetical protein
MDAMASEMRPVVREQSGVVIEVDGEPVAFIIALPNLMEWIADFDGRLLPFGWLKLAVNLLRVRLRTARIPLMGVKTKYQNSAIGAGLAMLAIEELHRRNKGLGLKTVELGWILETNTPMRRIIERIGGVKVKTYRIFERALA